MTLKKIIEGKAMQTEERLTLKFDGANEISLETLRQSLDIMLDTMKFVADRNITENDFCRFVVREVRKGSFVVDIGVIVDIATGIVTGISGLAGIIVGIFKLRKHLKGKEPKEIKKHDNGVKIENCEGSAIIVDNATYNTYVIDNVTEKSLARLSEILSKDAARTGFVIERSTIEGVKMDEIAFSKEDLANTSAALDIEKFDNNLVERNTDTWVRVSKAAYIGDSKWEFITDIDNTRINASIEDKDFLMKFRNSEITLTPNSVLHIRLRIRIKTDEKGNPTGKMLYAVVKVNKIQDMKTGVQISLFDG